MDATLTSFMGISAAVASPPASDSSDASFSLMQPTRPPVKNSSQERRKAEKQQLTKRIADLERDLTELLAKRAAVRCSTPAGVWRRLARRQFARRAQALDENQQLKTRLMHQLQVPKTLETLVRTRAEMLLEGDGTSGQRPQLKYPVHDLAALHEQCMDEIDQLYMQVDAVFDEATACQEFGQQPRRRTKLLDEKLCVDLHDTAYAPFPFDNVCSATWRAITTEYGRQNRLIEEYRCTDDEYTSKFRMPQASSSPEEKERYSATMTMRKFAEESRMVLVWQGLDIKETVRGSSAYSSESGWLIVERAEDPVTGQPSEDGTAVRVCTCYKPINEPDDARSSLRWGQVLPTSEPKKALNDTAVFTSHLLKGAEADMASITEAVEAILLDEAIGTSGEDLEAVVDGLWFVPKQLTDW